MAEETSDQPANPSEEQSNPPPQIFDSGIKPLISDTLTQCSKATSETLATQRKLLDKLLEVESKLSAVYNTDVALNECIKSALTKSSSLRDRISKLSDYIGTIEKRVIKVSQIVLKDALFS